MDDQIKKNSGAISSNLLNRHVYWVCFPERDGLDSLQGEFAEARKKHFTSGRKTVRTGKNEIVKGFDGKLQGRLGRRSLYWKKTAGKAAGRITLEESFELKTGPVLVRRDFRNIIVSRVFFDREQRWIRSEYYEPWDPVNARVIFRPSEASDTIERLDREPDGKPSRSTELYPIPYLAGTAEQSILNARFGEPHLVLNTAEGQFCYCTKREAEARKKALEEIKDGTIVLMPAWEVKGGSLTKDAGEEEAGVTFTSLEEYARIEAPEVSGAPEAEHSLQPVEETPAGLPPQPETEEFSPESTEPSPASREAGSESEGAGEDKPSSEESPESVAENGEKSAGEAEEAADVTEPGSGPDYSLIRDGKQAQQPGALAAYEGEYQDGRREGFGAYHYKNGTLSYAGFWKNDRKDGLGVSFRESDHALHIAKWENGRPGSFVSLFDTEGNLRYGGRIEDGQKQGAGVSFNQADGTVFVGKWLDGQPTGMGSSFDREGNLLYYGGWKDGKRSGHGTEFDKNGGIVFDGEWKDGKYHNGILYQRQTPETPPEDESPRWDI